MTIIRHNTPLLKYFTSLSPPMAALWQGIDMSEMSRHCVYVFHNGDRVMYVGRAKCLAARLGTYMQNRGHSFPAWAAGGWLLFWRNVETESEAKALESTLIRELCPLWNEVGVPRPPATPPEPKRMTAAARKQYIRARVVGGNMQIPEPPKDATWAIGHNGKSRLMAARSEHALEDLIHYFDHSGAPVEAAGVWRDRDKEKAFEQGLREKLAAADLTAPIAEPSASSHKQEALDLLEQMMKKST